MGMYSKRVWLNKESSASTGSVVAFHGETKWGDKLEVTSFFEVADCHGKVRLHRSYVDDMPAFISKLRTLAAIAEEFATFLESED
jgi:hypothetical protein